ncbi:site-specific integrase [uncultured Gordonia sp.]|uniref:tyrosine-type recombinase/integrase n=1 Tax=uncultured Gordonia sp. TaxID=198437 RepID=UPI00258AC8A7|nr:site-specific integrase [uncultured Gordonia sp.]
MASVQFRPLADGTKRWRVLWREAGKQRNLTFWDEDSAGDFARDIDLHGAEEALRIRGVIDAGGREVTLTQWLRAHVDSLTGIQQATRDRYLSYITHDIAPTIGVMPLSAVTEATIGRWVTDLGDASGKTVQNKHAFLSQGLKAAVRAGKIDRNPCEGRRLPRTLRQEMVFLSRAEFDRVHAAIGGRQPWSDLALWLVTTGMRFGEATALRPGDIDLDEGLCRISRSWKYSGSYQRTLGTTKTRRSDRTISLPPQAVEVARRRSVTDHEWLFSLSSGREVGPQDFHNRAWRKAREVLLNDKGEGKKPRVHDLRHTCASWMIAAGVPLVVVSRHLGHEDIQTTANTYSHVDQTSGRAAAAAIGAMFTAD